jgi:hypothetical protein
MKDYKLTDHELHMAAHNMRDYGGGFASAIADAYFVADLSNRAKLLNAFGDLFRAFVNFNESQEDTQP